MLDGMMQFEENKIFLQVKDVSIVHEAKQKTLWFDKVFTFTYRM